MATPAFRPDQAIGFIKAHQNTDGGWGYQTGKRSLVEPTAFALLALGPRGDKEAVGRAMGFLKSCLKENGAVGTGPSDPDGGWMAYAALLAFNAQGAAAEARRTADWILGFTDASDRFSSTDLAEIARRYRYDASIKGWPWTPGTTAWVEPTALFIIALVRAGTPPDHDRVRAGIGLIIDRKVPSGGWNFGNPYSMSYELEATLMSTSLALAALAAAGAADGRSGVAAGLRFIGRSLAGDVSTASLAWAVLALKSWPGGAATAPEASARLAGLQAEDGGFRGNIFETALAAVVLDNAGVLVGPAGRSGE